MLAQRLAAWLAVALCLFSCSVSFDLKQPAVPIHTPGANVLRFAGDVMLTRGVGRAIAEAHDPSLPFRQIATFLKAADIAFVNLESPFSDTGRRKQGGLIFKADPANIAGLQIAGVDVVSTANNHSRDAGPHGVEFTCKWLLAHGIEPVGSSASEAETHRGIVLERHGIRFGFLAYTYDQQNGNWRDIDERVAVIDIAAMKRDVSELAPRCSVVIVSMHNGIEYQKHPNQSQISFAHAAIDAGATLVVGHHPHVIQPFEVYGSGLIFYSLGNFVFDQFQRQETQRGQIAEVDFLGDFIESVQLFPVQITHNGPVLITISQMKKASGITRTSLANVSGSKDPLAERGDDQQTTPQ